MPTFITPTVIPTSSWQAAANTWNPVSLSGLIPSSSPGGIFIVSATSGFTLPVLGMRGHDSGDTWGQTTPGPISASQSLRTARMDPGTLETDFYPSSTGTGFQVLLIGYWNAGEMVLLQTAFSMGTATAGSYTAFNPSILSGGVVPSNALGVVVSCPKSPSGTYGVRSHGSTDDNIGSGGTINAGSDCIVGLTSAQFDLKTNSTTYTPFVTGYIPPGTPFTWNTAAINRTPGTANTPVPLTTETGAVVYLYQVEGGVNFTVCANGVTGLPFLKNCAGSLAQILSGSPPTANISSLTGTVLELGFFTSGPAASTPFTRTDFVVRDQLLVS